MDRGQESDFSPEQQSKREEVLKLSRDFIAEMRQSPPTYQDQIDRMQTQLARSDYQELSAAISLKGFAAAKQIKEWYYTGTGSKLDLAQVDFVVVRNDDLMVLVDIVGSGGQAGVSKAQVAKHYGDENFIEVVAIPRPIKKLGLDYHKHQVDIRLYEGIQTHPGYDLKI